MDNNNGAYFTPNFTPGAPLPATANSYTLQLSGATSGTYQGDATVTATLTASSGDPSPSTDGQPITFDFGANTWVVDTNGDSQATLTLPLTEAPGSYTLSASYAGDANDAPASATSSLDVSPISTNLSLNAPTSMVAGAASGVSATLTTGGDQPLAGQPVWFVVSNSSGTVLTTSSITDANGVAAAGVLEVPAAPTGNYTIAAYFASSAVPLANGSTYNASQADYTASSAQATQSTNISDLPPTLDIAAPTSVTATGPNTPVKYQVTAVNYDGAPATVSCNYVSGSEFPVGTAKISCMATDEYGNSSQASAQVDVVPTPLTVSVSGSQTYGGQPTWTFSASGFVNGDTTQSVITGTLTCSSPGSSSSPVATYAISSCSGLSVPGYYSIEYSLGSLIISTAPLTITASSPPMTYGGAVPSITPTIAGLVNGDTSATLTGLTCSSTVNATSSVGSYPTNCSGATDANYAISYEPGSITVSPASLTVIASSASISYGASVPAVTAKYVGFVNGDTSASLTTPPTCTTGAPSKPPVGNYTNSCTDAVDPNYTINYSNGNLVVGTSVLLISAGSGNMTYGGPVPAVTVSYSGFQNGDTAASLTTAPTCTSAAKSTSSVGIYATSCEGAVDPNYTISYGAGTTTVNQAPLTITAASPTKAYGGAVPAVTPGYSGFVNGDSAASLTTAPTCSTTAKSSSPVGSYPTSCTGAVDNNYTISYVGGSIKVTPAPLNVTASSATTTYGQAPPAITPSYSGFVNGDSASSLTAQPKCSTTATQSSALGTYPTSCSGAVDANYTISYVAGAVTVTQSTMMVLGSGAGVVGITGQSHLSVTGNLDVNSSSSGSVNASGQSTVKATGTFISPSSSSLALSGQSTSSFGSTEVLPAETDPYSSLAAPSTSGLTVYKTSTIQGPGVYTSAVAISGQTKVQLASGTYIFDNGLTISGQAQVTTASGGVLLYFAGGALTVTGQSSATLSPLTTGTYAGIALFESRTDSAALSLNGQGQATSFMGTVYAPDAALDVTGQSSVSAAAVLVKSTDVTGQSTISVG